ncbi:MAG TPA: TRIC cation channel family protein [Actinocatenispora sp.]
MDLAGVFANAILGGAVAARERLDVIGFVTLAVISGTGGGLIRDTLLQHGTPVALTDYAYLLTALGGAGVAFLLRIEGRGWNRILLFADALALGFWAAAGAQKTLQVGLGWLPAVLLGSPTLGLVAGIVFAAGLRLVSVRYNWTLPQGRNWSLDTGREWWARVPTRPLPPTVKSWRATRLTRRTPPTTKK